MIYKAYCNEPQFVKVIEKKNKKKTKQNKTKKKKGLLFGLKQMNDIAIIEQLCYETVNMLSDQKHLVFT